MVSENQPESSGLAVCPMPEFSNSETAIYISELAQELESMAKRSDMKMVGYLLAMAAREASQEVFPVEAFITTTPQ
ncbi:MAG: hypothetical protein COA52_14530 [Hyphomicrobiales bacterium]|nr:MAG: hypothetical protein COA52_14530 [Hyphomicrobiales bacterium]